MILPLVLTLESAFFSAIQQSEALKEHSVQVEQAALTHRQAIGALLPSATLFMSETLQDSPLNSQSTVSGQIAPRVSPNWRINLTQPLFRGLSEYAALRQTSALEKATEFQKQQATRALYLDVAQTFYLTLQSEQDLVLLEHLATTLDQRIAELKRRVLIGRSRPSELLSAQSQRAQTSAQTAQANAQVKILRGSLQFLTGMDPSAQLDSTVSTLRRPDSENRSLLFETLKSRPDLLALQQQTLAASESISLARGAFFPALTLAGNYYFKRAGAFQNVHWDASLNLTWSLFSGGSDLSQTRIAARNRERLELQSARLGRQAKQEIIQAHEQILADRVQITELSTAVISAQKAYDAVLQDFQKGLTPSLEVLQALVSLTEFKRTLRRAEYAMLLDEARLAVATGAIPTPAEAH